MPGCGAVGIKASIDFDRPGRFCNIDGRIMNRDKIVFGRSLYIEEK